MTAPAVASGKAGDFDTCARAIRVAVEEAAAMAGAPIKRVVASYSGPGISSQIVLASARVRGRTVASRDVENVIAAAMQAAPTPELSVLHLEPLRYYVDDGELITDPHGHSGKVLSLEACIVTAPTEAINALKSCIALAGAEVEELMAAPKAAALAALTPDERAQGAVDAAHVLGQELACHRRLLPVLECFRLEGRVGQRERYTPTQRRSAMRSIARDGFAGNYRWRSVLAPMPTSTRPERISS